jgi:hypothetical protein
MSATGDCLIGCYTTYQEKQCKYNGGLSFAMIVCHIII